LLFAVARWREQPLEYWIDKFARAGATYSADMTRRFQKEWSNRGVEWSRARTYVDPLQ
jgi:hypothetical protein